MARLNRFRAWLNPPIGHLAREAREVVWQGTDFITDREVFARNTVKIPRRFHVAVAKRYVLEHNAHGGKAANVWLGQLHDGFSTDNLELAASDGDIVDYAERRARSVQRIVTDTGTTTSAELRARLERYCHAHGVRPPQAKALQGTVARLMSAAWWRRALRREVVREVERQAVRLGLVHRRASIYASAEAVARRKEQKKRIARYLEATVAENSSGQAFTLADLASRNVSNPRVRRTELMVRVRGFQEFAEQAGHVGMFYTMTAPSRMHAVLSATCQQNPKFDGTTPRQAHQYLGRQWAKVRAALDRKSAHVYGVRVAEPHHDGTPHWHLLMFMPRALEPFVTATLRDYATREDAAELDTEAAQRARFHAVMMDAQRGGAAGYVAKYVAKNIDAHNIGADLEAEDNAPASVTVEHVDAWAATWGIRQFQIIGGPAVGIWRELRRLRQAPQLELFDRFWLAAESHTWREYMRLMGGNAIRRRDRALQAWRVEHDAVNAYGEDAPPRLEGVRHVVLEHCRTRFEQWQVRPNNGGAARQVSRASARIGFNSQGAVAAVAVPWTRVNNCTDADLAADFARSVQQIGAPP